MNKILRGGNLVMVYLCKIGFNGGNFGPQLLTFCELNTEIPFNTPLKYIIFADLVFNITEISMGN